MYNQSFSLRTVHHHFTNTNARKIGRFGETQVFLTRRKNSHKRGILRKMFPYTKEQFEKNLRSAELLSKEFPHDAKILTECGKVLVCFPPEFADGHDSNKLLQDGIEKLEAALHVNPEMPEALTWLGITYTTKGSQELDPDAAKGYFDKAVKYCEEACAMQPGTWLYKEHLKRSLRARETRFGTVGGAQLMHPMAHHRLLAASDQVHDQRRGKKSSDTYGI